MELEPPTQEELRLEQIASQLTDLSERVLVIKRHKKEGKEVRRAIDVLEKDLEVVRGMVYATYILAQNNEDPI